MNGYLKTVSEFVEKMFVEAADCYNDPPSPLFADIVRIEDGKHYSMDGYESTEIHTEEPVVSSNMIFQQHFYRTCTMLSALTGNPKYKDRAVEAIKYNLDNYTLRSGRFCWGTHHDINLKTLDDHGYMHELKCYYPFYDLYYELDPEKTLNCIRGTWRGHILNRKTFDLNRHAFEYDKFKGQLNTTEGLENVFKLGFGDPKPFAKVDGLTFCNTASDLMFGALKVYEYTGEIDALKAAEGLHNMYIKHRHPKTNLDSYMYGLNYDGDHCGDRAYKYMWDQLGPAIYEGHMLNKATFDEIYCGLGAVVCAFKRKGGEIGEAMFKRYIPGIEAYINLGYDREIHRFHNMLSDGQIMDHFKNKNGGYFGGSPFGSPFIPSSDALYNLLDTAQLDGNELIHEAVRDCYRENGIGDIGNLDGSGSNFNFDTENSDELTANAMLLRFELTGNEVFLSAADRILDNAMKAQYKDGYFKAYDNEKLCLLESLTPLVMLKAEALRRGRPEIIPEGLYYRRLSSWRRS